MTVLERSIKVSTTSPLTFESARDVLLDDAVPLFGEASSVEEQGDGRVSMDLGVAIGAGTSVHQVVELALGVPRVVDDGLVLPLEWHALGHERLLPTFRGALELSKAGRATHLQLCGDYSVPLGLVGRFGDGVLGRRLARQSLEALLERLALRLSSETRSRHGATSRPTDDTFEPSEQGHPEIYVG